MLSRLALYAPRTLISFHASRAFLSRCLTTGLRNCDIRYWKRKRKREGRRKKKGREEFDRVAKFIARLCVKTSKKFFLKLVEGMVSDWRCWGKLNPPRKLIMVDKQDSRRYTG